MANQMKTLLDRLTEKGEAALQITFTNGTIIPGAVKRTDLDGMYVLRTMIGDPSRGKKLQPIDYHFEAETVYAIAVAVETLIEPATGGIIPGRIQ